MQCYLRSLMSVTLLLSFLSSAAAAQERTFHLGIISKKVVEKKVEGYAPLARYVGARLQEYGVTGGKLVVANDLEEMLGLIRRRAVDVVLESAFATLQMQEKAGMKPRLLVWKHGMKEYRTVFIARRDSPLRNLGDLKGRLIALQDPGSTSAFLLPTVELKAHGLKVVQADGKASPSAVRFVLVSFHKNQLFWVTEKRADAAAFSSDDWENLTDQQRSGLKIIHTTRPVLRYVASFHPALPPLLAKAIADVMVKMDGDPAGRTVLEGASEIRKMRPLTAQDYGSLEFVRRRMQGR